MEVRIFLTMAADGISPALASNKSNIFNHTNRINNCKLNKIGVLSHSSNEMLCRMAINVVLWGILLVHKVFTCDRLTRFRHLPYKFTVNTWIYPFQRTTQLLARVAGRDFCIFVCSKYGMADGMGFIPNKVWTFIGYR